MGDKGIVTLEVATWWGEWGKGSDGGRGRGFLAGEVRGHDNLIITIITKDNISNII